MPVYAVLRTICSGLNIISHILLFALEGNDDNSGTARLPHKIYCNFYFCDL